MAAWLPGLAVALVLVAGFVTLQVGAGDQRHVTATVQSANWRLNGDTGQHYPFIQARLDNGASVRVGSIVSDLPAVGTRITVRERALLFAYMTTYEWDGPALAPAAAPLVPLAADMIPSAATPTPVSHP